MTDVIVLVAGLVMMTAIGLGWLRMYILVFRSASAEIYWTCGGCGKRICFEGDAAGRALCAELDTCWVCGWERDAEEDEPVNSCMFRPLGCEVPRANDGSALYRVHSYTPFQKGAAQEPDEPVPSWASVFKRCSSCGHNLTAPVRLSPELGLCAACWNKGPEGSSTNVRWLPEIDVKIEAQIPSAHDKNVELQDALKMSELVQIRTNPSHVKFWNMDGEVIDLTRIRFRRFWDPEKPVCYLWDTESERWHTVRVIVDPLSDVDEPDDWPCQHFHGGSVEAFRESTNGLCQHSECRPAEEGPVWNPPHVTIDRANGIMRVTAVYIGDEQWAWIEACIKARSDKETLGQEYVWQLVDEIEETTMPDGCVTIRRKYHLLAELDEV